jgi:hypothetical protein
MVLLSKSKPAEEFPIRGNRKEFANPLFIGVFPVQAERSEQELLERRGLGDSSEPVVETLDAAEAFRIAVSTGAFRENSPLCS